MLVCDSAYITKKLHEWSEKKYMLSRQHKTESAQSLYVSNN